ncbi:hypothetical protein WME99_11280 [Sorangium sp. So ce136]|uniref:hypothetical protein n=1 Tax=Sorangium sp. So ce136 TaxID=3133284 RepID=UPI003F103BBD
MPLLDALDFVKTDLIVRYRGSAEPQELSIDVKLARKAGKERAPQIIRPLIDTIAFGAAGGAEFAPWLGEAELLSGPWDPPESLGPNLSYRLRIAAVSPLFMRSMVENLREVGFRSKVKSMSILGSLAPDASPLSVHEGHVRAWLDDPTAHCSAWPEVPFPLKTRRTDETAEFRVVLAKGLTPKLREDLETLSYIWMNSVDDYVDEEGEQVELHRLDQRMPAFGRTKTEFRASFKEFLHVREPSRAVLSNMLVRFHHRVAKIAEAEIAV